MPIVTELLTEVYAEMARYTDHRFAVGVRNYFTEPVDPWGVRSSDLRKVEQSAYRTLKRLPSAERHEFFEHLWRSGKLEEGAMVCHLYRRLGVQDPRQEWELFESWIDRYVHNWAHSDGIATWLFAGCITKEPALARKLPAWTQSLNRWKRRASAASLLQEAKAGRSLDRILEIADLLSGDADEMVQKGVGWLLKETYPKQPSAAVAYLLKWPGARLVVRLAAEKMTAAHRAEFGLR